MSQAANRPQPIPRSAFKHFEPVPTRWADNDIYGHVNNVAYYAWFDTAVNAYLIRQGALDIHAGDTIGLVVHTECDYFVSLAFPTQVEIGIRVARMGQSSVQYELGVFAQSSQSTAAVGRFVHVYVDRMNRSSVPLPEALRAALLPLL